MKTKATALVLLVLMVTLLTGCVGGNDTKSTPVVRSEIDTFFSLYDYVAKARDLDALIDLYQLPVTVTQDDPLMQIRFDEVSHLSELLLGPRIYM